MINNTPSVLFHSSESVGRTTGELSSQALRRKSRGAVWMAVVFGFIPSLLAQPTDKEPIQLELIVPPAPTYVIGDPIQLNWRFKNVTAEPLSFMWEGCCRVNGNLTVKKGSEEIPPIPPGQALAHMFAKAEVVPPGKARDFDTRVSDWVQLEQGGEYTLQGRYVGLRPEQRPQVPHGVGLWRERAESAPVSLKVISPTEYLHQRADRLQQRQIALELTGPNMLPPLKPTPLQLKIQNTGQTEQKFIWPNSFQVWILNPGGQRVANVATAIEGTYEDVTLAPGGTITRAIPFTSDRLEGERFGTYSVFIDLQGDGDRPRVPSNPSPMKWELTSAHVTELIQEATQGPKRGIRNAPLKMLRVHLSDLADTLAALPTDSLSPAAASLAQELRLAACLKPIAPVPGRIEVPLAVVGDGQWQLDDPRFSQCFAAPAKQPLEQLNALGNLKRHLGWELQPSLRPNLENTVEQVAKVARALSGLPEVFNAPPSVVVSNTLPILPAMFQFPATPSQAEVTVRLQNDGKMNLQTIGSVSEAQMLSSPDALEQWITASKPATARVSVHVPGPMAWTQLAQAMQPFVRRAWTIEVSVMP